MERDIVSLGLLQKYFITLRLYNESSFGFRSLGEGRVAIDLTYIAIVLERY